MCDSSPAILDEVLKSIGVVRKAGEDSLVVGREFSLDAVAGTLLESDRDSLLDLMHCCLMDADERRSAVTEIEFMLFSICRNILYDFTELHIAYYIT